MWGRKGVSKAETWLGMVVFVVLFNGFAKIGLDRGKPYKNNFALLHISVKFAGFVKSSCHRSGWRPHVVGE